MCTSCDSELNNPLVPLENELLVREDEIRELTRQRDALREALEKLLKYHTDPIDENFFRWSAATREAHDAARAVLDTTKG